jgi:hypothetical protein
VLSGEEVLSDEERRFEGLGLSLRTRLGVPLEALPDHPELEGLVDRSGGRAVLTVRGRLLANTVTARLRTDGPSRPGARTVGATATCRAGASATGPAGTMRADA